MTSLLPQVWFELTNRSPIVAFSLPRRNPRDGVGEPIASQLDALGAEPLTGCSRKAYKKAWDALQCFDSRSGAPRDHLAAFSGRPVKVKYEFSRDY
ncbi:MAG: hypothetical protein ACUVQQ_02795 [Thermogutta sp.]